MNQKNVEALTALIRAYVDAPGAGPVTCIVIDPHRDLAEWLAARGVLVPASLSDTEIFMLPGDHSPGLTDQIARDFRSELERIAKGEGEP